MTEIDDLKQKIAHHNKLYYEDSTTEISDEEYDKLTKRLRELTSGDLFSQDLFTQDLFTLVLFQTQTKLTTLTRVQESRGRLVAKLYEYLDKVSNHGTDPDDIQHTSNEVKSAFATFSHIDEDSDLIDGRLIKNFKRCSSFLKAYISRHNALYYENSAPEISDAEYDECKKLYESCRKALDLLSDDDAKAKSVASTYNTFDELPLFTLGLFQTQTKFEKIAHRSPMLSLGNVFDEADLGDFLKRINNFLNTEGEFYEFVAEKKIDGVSFSALYDGGQLVRILTRGDGEIGENITENILTIPNFPTKISINDAIEVRGEVYMLNSDFEELNKQNAKTGGKIFANPRNATSGSIRQLDSAFAKARNLQYYAYSGIFYGQNPCKTQGEIYDFLAKNGFCVNDFTVCNSIEKLLGYYCTAAKNRFEIGYDIDGIVYKINNLAMQKRLGMTANSPRWAVAHKFDSKKTQTRLEKITLQVGRTGIVTPVAELFPVNLGGVVIKRATLHNKDEIHRLGINIGDVVEIERAGDVIPKILKVVEKNSLGVFDFPQNCPCCGGELVQTDTLIRCTNVVNCTEQTLGRLKYFVSKDCLNIVGLGEKQLQEFFYKGFILNFSDIFLLPAKIPEIDMHTWEGWGEISIKNLISAIEKAKTVSLSRLINAFGIYSVGIENAKILAEFFQNGEGLLSENRLEKLMELDGIGEKTAKEVLAFLHANKVEIGNLLQNIQVFHEKQPQGNRGTVLFTGTMSISRAEAKEIAQKSGFSVASSVVRGLEYLICGQDSGSKLKKAQEIGVKIISEEEFLSLCQN